MVLIHDYQLAITDFDDVADIFYFEVVVGRYSLNVYKVYILHQIRNYPLVFDWVICQEAVSVFVNRIFFDFSINDHFYHLVPIIDVSHVEIYFNVVNH